MTAEQERARIVALLKAAAERHDAAGLRLWIAGAIDFNEGEGVAAE